MRPRRYAIIGTGAVGGFYGGRLARAGLDVHFLLHSDYDHVRRHGLVVQSVDGDFVLPRVAAYDRPDRMPPADVVLVALKTTHNHRLPDLLPAPAGDDGLVLMLQNGLGPEQQAAAVVGPDRVMAGLCFLCSNKVGPGHVRHLDYGFVTLADYAADGRPRGITGRMRDVAADFRAAGIQVDLDPDLLGARWRKLVWNVPFNGLSVVLGATSDRLVADAHTRRLAEDLMRDVADGARACGRTVDDAFIRHMLDLTRKMAPYKTSMALDYEARRPLEIGAIFAAPIRAARHAGAPMPRVDALYRLLAFLDARNRAAPPPVAP